MREKFHNSLQRSIHGMLKTLDQVMEQVKGFCPEAKIPVKELDPFLGCYRGGFRSDEALPLRVLQLDLLFFFFVLFFFLM